MKQKNESYNKTKMRGLEVLENGTLIDGPTFANRVGIRLVRRVYAYLDHLAKLGLVIRKADCGWNGSVNRVNQSVTIPLDRWNP